MQIVQIKMFLAIVVAGTFSEAAEMLYTTQATISKQIAALEKEWNTSFFDRSHRKPELTQSGRVFLKYAQTFMDTYNALGEELSVLTDYQGGKALVASIPVMAQYGIIRLIGRFRTAHPEVQLIVDERESSDIPGALEDRQYEMAFCRLENLDLSRYQSIKLYEDSIAVLLPASHPFAKEEALSLRQLQNETFMLLGENTSLFHACVNACKRYGGFTPNVGYTGTRLENIVEMVGQGMGISLAMKTPAQYVIKQDVVIVPLREQIGSEIGLVRLRRRMPSIAGDRFWVYVRKLYRSC